MQLWCFFNDFVNKICDSFCVYAMHALNGILLVAILTEVPDILSQGPYILAYVPDIVATVPNIMAQVPGIMAQVSVYWFISHRCQT